MTNENTNIDSNLTDENLAELALMPLLKYEQVREGIAKEYGYRVSVLDKEVDKFRVPDVEDKEASKICQDFDIWHEKVNGSELADKLVKTIRRYSVLPEGAAEAVVLWILHSHAHDTAKISAILALESPEKRCGKTTLLNIIQELVPRSLVAANMSPAVLFRSVEMFGPTLLIDEGDTFLKDKEELRGILNSGHNRKSASVLRCVGDNHEPTPFNTWGPKAIALIGTLPDTLQDRSIVIPLQRKTALEKVESLRFDQTDHLTLLGSQAAKWTIDNEIYLTNHDPENLPGGLHDRAHDNWRHLYAIADCLGGHWPETARVISVKLQMDEDVDEGSLAVLLLGDIKAAFADRKLDRLATANIIHYLEGLEDRPWAEYRHGKPLSGQSIARLLKSFAISPGAMRLPNGPTKGYKMEQFKEAWDRYLDLDMELNE